MKQKRSDGCHLGQEMDCVIGEPWILLILGKLKNIRGTYFIVPMQGCGGLGSFRHCGTTKPIYVNST